MVSINIFINVYQLAVKNYYDYFFNITYPQDIINIKDISNS